MHAQPATIDQQLRAMCEEIRQQGWLNFLLPWGPAKITVRPDEAAKALGYKGVDSIYAELERPTTWLEAERRVGVDRAEIRLTARSVELQMAREALEGGMVALRNGRPQAPLFMERLKSLLANLSRAQIAEIETELSRLKGGRK